jgi:hypothetical protein
MLIIRRLNCIDAASGLFLSVCGRPVHRIPDAASIQFNLLMMSM